MTESEKELLRLTWRLYGKHYRNQKAVAAGLPGTRPVGRPRKTVQEPTESVFEHKAVRSA